MDMERIKKLALIEDRLDSVDDKLNNLINYLESMKTPPTEKVDNNDDEFISVEISTDDIKEEVDMIDELLTALKEVSLVHQDFNLTCEKDKCIDETLYSLKKLMDLCYSQKQTILRLTNSIKSVKSWFDNRPII